MASAALEALSTTRGTARKTQAAKKAVRKIGLGQFQFRLVWLRQGKDPVVLTTTEAISWTEPDDDAGPVVTGSATVRQPTYARPLRFVEGDRVRIDVAERQGAAYRELQTMRVQEVNETIVPGSIVLDLAVDLATAARSESSFLYAKSKSRPRGWRFDEIVRDVCDRYGIAIGALPKGKNYYKSLATKETDAPLFNASPLDIIIAAIRKEQDVTGRRFVVRWRLDKLWVYPFTPSALLLEMGPAIIEAAFSRGFRSDFATALTVRNFAVDSSGVDDTGTKKKKFRKIVVPIVNEPAAKAAQARYGVVHRNVFVTDVDSIAEARQLGLRHLARVMRPERAFSLTHPGVPWLRRGHTIRVVSRENDINLVVFVDSIQHQVSSSGYTMDVVLKFEQPYAVYPTDSITEDYVAPEDTASATQKAASEKTTAAPEPERASARKDDSWTNNIRPFGAK